VESNIERPRVARGRSAQTEENMNIFYIIGVVVVVIAVLGFLGLR
jgi:hypothetical protein